MPAFSFWSFHDDGKRVPDVHRDGHAVELVERRLAAPNLALVLDVIVDEKGVVEDLQRNG